MLTLTTSERAMVQSVLNGLTAAWTATALLYLADITALPSEQVALVLSTIAGFAVGLIFDGSGVKPVERIEAPARLAPRIATAPATLPVPARRPERLPTLRPEPKNRNRIAPKSKNEHENQNENQNENKIEVEATWPDDPYPTQCPRCGGFDVAEVDGDRRATRCGVCHDVFDGLGPHPVSVRSWLHQGKQGR